MAPSTEDEMSSKQWQHYVPQHVLRTFAGHQHAIGLTTIKDGRSALNASIKKQCARNNIYGHPEIEAVLAHIDSQHAAMYRQVLRAAWDPTYDFLEFPLASLCEALLLQRMRVPRNITVARDLQDEMCMEMAINLFSSHEDKDFGEKAVAALKSGQAGFVHNEVAIALDAIVMALGSVEGLIDLDFLILRNETSTPFILSDSPCIFCNPHLQHVSNRGVLGVQTPGLIVTQPVNPNTAILLFDPKAYDIETDDFHVDVFDPRDIGSLNAMQVHSAVSSIFFADASAASYAEQLVASHRPLRVEKYAGILRHEKGSVLIDGKPSEDEVIMTYEKQMPIAVDFTFLRARPAADNWRSQKGRTPEIHDAIHDRVAEWIKESEGHKKGVK